MGSPSMVYNSGSMSSIAILPWSVVMGVFPKKHIFETGI
jgi:hypothetical protein